MLTQKKLNVVLFLQTLAQLHESGIPMIAGLGLLETSQQQKKSAQCIHQLKQSLLMGKSIYDAFKIHEKHFDSLTCYLIKLGEETGKLETMIRLASDYLSFKEKIVAQVKQALFYPGLILCSSMLLILFLLFWVIPQFENLFHESHVVLPHLTSWLFCLSHVLRERFVILVALAIGIILFFMIYRAKNGERL